MVVTEFIAERPDVADEEIMHNSNRVVSMLHEYSICRGVCFFNQRR